MTIEIDTQYREKLSNILRRNIQKDQPMTGIVQMLAEWRKLRSERIKEENREFALQCLKEEQELSLKSKKPYISMLTGFDNPAEQGAQIITLIPRISRTEEPVTSS